MSQRFAPQQILLNFVHLSCNFHKISLDQVKACKYKILKNVCIDQCGASHIIYLYYITYIHYAFKISNISLTVYIKRTHHYFK